MILWMSLISPQIGYFRNAALHDLGTSPRNAPQTFADRIYRQFPKTTSGLHRHGRSVHADRSYRATGVDRSINSKSPMCGLHLDA